MENEELPNEAGMNWQKFRTDAPDSVIEEKMDLLIEVGLDDAESLKRALEAEGYECGEITRERPS